MRALVHSGGGSNGDWGIGVVKYLLLQEKTRYDMYFGVSTGALTTSFLAQFKDGEEVQAIKGIEDIYFGLKNNKSIYKKWGVWPLTSILPRLPVLKHFRWFQKMRKPSLYDASPLRKLVYEGLDARKLLSSGKRLFVGAVRVGGDRAYRIFSERSPFIKDAVLASAAFPVMFQPVKVGSYYYLDGGIRNVVPFDEAIRMGADEIDVIITSPTIPLPSEYNAEDANILETLVEATGTMVDEITSDDMIMKKVAKCLRKNGQPGYRTIKVRVFRPSRDLGESLNFGADKNPTHLENMNLGYLDAAEQAKAQKG